MKRSLLTTSPPSSPLGLTAACGGGAGARRRRRARPARSRSGYSNNPEEIAWGKQMVEAWNADHPDEKVTAQEIPAGKTSEEVIGAAITAGNAPCLVFNTARPPYRSSRSRAASCRSTTSRTATTTSRSAPATTAEQYQSPDGKFYQMPWKPNPVMIFYNKEMFKKAGLDPENPPLATYDEFLATAQEARRQRRRQAAISPSPASEFFQSWFDFYPLYAAETGGTQLVEDGKATFDDEHGKAVANSGRDVRGGLRPAGEVQRRLVRRRQGGHGDRRPLGDRGLQGQGRLGRRARADPGRHGRRARSTPSATRRTSAIYTACENQGTAWDVLKFATSEEQDGKLLETTGQMPIRKDLPTTYAGLLRRATPTTRCSPTRQRAPSRCRTCRTRSRSGRRSATTTPRR